MGRRRPRGAGRVLPRAAAGRTVGADRPAGAGLAAGRAEPDAGLRGLAQGPGVARYADRADGRGPAFGDPQRHRFRDGGRGGGRRGFAQPSGRPDGQRSPGVPDRAFGQQRRGLGRGPDGPFGPRHRDERGTARGRWPHPEPRHRLQGRGLLRRGDAVPRRHLPAPRRSDHLRGRSGRALGPATRHARPRAQGGADPRQLPQQGRSPRQRRRPRHPRRHGPRVAADAGRGLRRREHARGRAGADGAADGRPDQLAYRPRRTRGWRGATTSGVRAAFRRSPLGGQAPDPRPLGSAGRRPLPHG